MMRGFEQALYILPFDHRGSLKTGMFGWNSLEVTIALGTMVIAPR